MGTLVSRGTAENNLQGKGKTVGASLDPREHSHSEGPEQASRERKLLTVRIPNIPHSLENFEEVGPN